MSLSKQGTTFRRGNEELSRYNYYFRRTVTRTVPKTINEDVNTEKALLCDFLGLITAINALYSQQDVLPMQQIDNRRKEAVGAGAVFEVSSITTGSTKLSDTAADQTHNVKRSVILKRSPLELFRKDGKVQRSPPQQRGAASFVMELRILSNPEIRNCNNIVKMLGVGWEYSRWNDGCPCPSLMLERAVSTLGSFQEKHQKLPLKTKLLLCLDVSNGLLALHQSGIIHGDVKLENILIFENERMTAKVADFSHSILDTGEETYLIGCTAAYAAPEWKKKLSTPMLRQTDIYSFGFVLASVMLGYDVVNGFLESTDNGRTGEERYETLEAMKSDESILNNVIELLKNQDDIELLPEFDCASSMSYLIKKTLRFEPEKRDLVKVSEHLTSLVMHPIEADRAYQNELHSLKRGKETILKQINEDTLAIPYHAMRNMSYRLKTQVVESLKVIAQDFDDTRGAAAAWELCVCHASGFGVQLDCGLAHSWLIRAAEKGDSWARSMAYRLTKAFDQNIPPNVPLTEWLTETASEGSLVAFQSLQELGKKMDAKAAFKRQILPAIGKFEASVETMKRVVENHPEDAEGPGLEEPSFRSEVSGTNCAHDELLPGRSELSAACLNYQKAEGDTELILACKLGNVKAVAKLIQLGADASATNGCGETCFHFLAHFSDECIPEAAKILFEAGADPTAEARKSSIVSEYQIHPDASCDSKVKAILLNNPVALEELMALEKTNFDSMSGEQIRRHNSAPKKLFAWACRLCNFGALQVLEKHVPHLFKSQSLNEFEMWIGGHHFTLASLLITGCVEEKPHLGFNFPERFYRSLLYGADYQTQFQKTFDCLKAHGLELNSGLCGGQPCPLFFAITQNREDVIELILKDETQSLSDWTRESLQERDEFSPFEQGISQPPKTNVPGLSFYDCTNPGVKHRRKRLLSSAICFSIQNGHRNILRQLIRYHNREALDMGMEFPVTIPSKKKFRWHLTNIHDRHRWSTRASIPSAAHLFPNLRPSLGRRVSIFPVVPAETNKKFFRKSEIFDGRLNYSILYMSAVASSGTFDIGLAEILVDEMARKGVENHFQWHIRNSLEAHCFPEVPNSPIMFSALFGWDELTDYLFKQGADRLQSKSNLVFLLRRDRYLRKTAWLGVEESKHDCEKAGWPEPFQDVDLVFRGTMNLLNSLTVLEQASGKITDEDMDLLINSRGLFKNRNAEIWSVVENLLQRRGACEDERKKSKSLLKKAAIARNYDALKVLLKLGYSPKGSTMFITPLDCIVSGRRYQSGLDPEPSDLKLDKRCERLIRDHGGTRGLLYFVEIQLLGNMLLLSLQAATIYAIFGTVEYQQSANIHLIKEWSRAYDQKEITAWELTFRIPFAYTPFIPILLAILIMVIAILVWGDDAGEDILSLLPSVIIKTIFSFSFSSIPELGEIHPFEIQWNGPTWRLIAPHLPKPKTKRLKESARTQETTETRAMESLPNHGTNDIISRTASSFV